MSFAKKKEETVVIGNIQKEYFNIRIVGDSPLIVHAWEEKAKKMILDKQMKVATTKDRDIRNPVADFINSLYWLEGKPTEYTEEAFEKACKNGAKFGFPVTGVKAGACAAAYRMNWTKNQVVTRGSFFVNGIDNQDFIEIKSDKPPRMREDMVRIAMGGADVRYRGEFENWHADLTILFNASGTLTKEMIIDFINAGGFCCGLGESRPERGGQNGMYHVEAIN